jgi:hypothetical protein
MASATRGSPLLAAAMKSSLVSTVVSMTTLALYFRMNR